MAVKWYDNITYEEVLTHAKLGWHSYRKEPEIVGHVRMIEDSRLYQDNFVLLSAEGRKNK